MDMEQSKVRGLQFLTVQVVGAVAVIHLVVALDQLAGIVANGLLVDYLTGTVFVHPRAFLFVVSSVVIFGGVLTTARGLLARRQAYQLAILVLGTYLLGWIAWHSVLDHGLALSGGGGGGGDHAHSHRGLGDTLISHYVEPIWAVVTASTGGTPGTGRTFLGVVSKTLELLGIALLVVLLRVDPEAAAEGDGFSLGLENPETK